MDGRKNLIPMSARSAEEVKAMQSKGGRNSGVTRRKKADFRKTLNLLLSCKAPADSDLALLLASYGMEPTLENGANLAMIRQALMGDVKAYEAIAKYSGQSAVPDADERAKRKAEKLDQELTQAKIDAVKAKGATAEDNAEDDGFIDALTATAADDWSDGDDGNI